MLHHRRYQANNSQSRHHGRSQKGSCMIDLGFACLALIVLAVFGMNMCFALVSFSMTDRACRDAARAAAQASNRTQAQQLAQAVLRSYKSQSSLMVTQPLLQSLDFTDFGGNPPSGQSPFVRVTTFSSVRMPAPVRVFGQNVFSATIPLRKTYVFPIVKVNVPV